MRLSIVALVAVAALADARASAADLPTAGGGVLVWRAVASDPDGESMLLRGPTVLAKRPGLWLSAPGHLWRIGTTQRKVAMVDCACAARAGNGRAPPACRVAKSFDVLVAYDQLNKKQVDLAEMSTETGSDEDDMEYVDWTTKVVGAVGSRLLVEESRSTYVCGANHPVTEAQFNALDLGSGKPVPALSDEDAAKVERAVGRQARKLCIAKADRTDCDAKGGEVVWWQPAYLDGVLRPIWQFTWSGTPNGGADMWSSYTRSVRLPAAVVPAGLERFATPPAQVRRMLSAKLPVTAWSPVADADLDRVQREFTAPDGPGTTVVAVELRPAELPQAVHDFVESNSDAVRTCYQRSLDDHPMLAGRLRVSFVIQSDGSVLEARAEQSVMDGAVVEGCILGAIRAWKFPWRITGGPTRIEHTFVLAPPATTEPMPTVPPDGE